MRKQNQTVVICPGGKWHNLLLYNHLIDYVVLVLKALGSPMLQYLANSLEILKVLANDPFDCVCLEFGLRIFLHRTWSLSKVLR